MTRKERAQVVELLRCSVEIEMNGAGGIFGAIQCLYAPHATTSMELRGRARRLWSLAVTARASVGPGWAYSYDDQCLEAAARVEEGIWP